MATPLLSPSGEFIPRNIQVLPHVECTFVNTNQTLLSGTSFFQQDYSMRFDAHQLPSINSVSGNHLQSAYLEFSIVFDIKNQKFCPPNSTSLHNFQTWDSSWTDGLDNCSLCRSQRFKQLNETTKP